MASVNSAGFLGIPSTVPSGGSWQYDGSQRFFVPYPTKSGVKPAMRMHALVALRPCFHRVIDQ